MILASCDMHKLRSPCVKHCLFLWCLMQAFQFTVRAYLMAHHNASMIFCDRHLHLIETVRVASNTF